MSAGDDIAIVGMSAMFAGAPDLRAYWQNIVDRRNCMSEAGDRWAAPYYDPTSTENDRIYTRRGGFLGEFVDFNPVEFGVMPSTVATGDADHFLALKLSRDALSDAGYGDRPFDGAKTGIILGRGTYVNRGYNTLLHHGQVVDQTLELLRGLVPGFTPEMAKELRARLKEKLPPFTPEVIPSLVPNVITGRIANRLDLLGPNYIVDAACASSLIALEQAIKELRSGRCDMMLAGGVHTTTPPQLYMMFALLKALSRTDISPFDAGADGTLLGEGLGILVLKRLGDALRDGDRVYAVVKGVGSASDGRALGLLAPRLEGQLLAMQRAYAENGVDPDTVELIEAHGTGMPVGDATEVATMKRIYGPRDGRLPRRALGSVKSMIGHCIPAAGIAGVIKSALALYHRVLPPTLCANVNPGLKLEESSLYVNNATRPWIHAGTGPRRAGVNAFGFGGINAHAILEEHPQASGPALHASWSSELFVFSANGTEGLIEALREVHRLVVDDPGVSAAGLACALAARPHGRCRLAMVCADVAELRKKIELALEKLPSAAADLRRRGIHYGGPGAAGLGRVAFLFPGEGGQYPNMLLDLSVYFPKVRAWFDVLDEAFAGIAPDAPSRVVFPAPTGLTEDERERVARAITTLEIGSASVFVAGMALYELLGEFGVSADALVGHSTGEGTALIAGGIVRLPTRAETVAAMRRFAQAYRDLGAEGRIPTGALMTVGAVDPERLDAVVSAAGGRLHVALDNCPNQVVLFGERADIDAAVARLGEAGGICVPMPFDRAYHTPLFMPLEPRLRVLYDGLDVGPAATPVYSCATTEPFPSEAEAIRALATRQWFSRVRFRDTITRLHASGVRTFVEVGPGGNLTGFVKDILERGEYLALASNVEGKPGLQQLQQLLGQLYVRGAAVDFAPLYRARSIEPLAPGAKREPAKRAVLDLMMPRMEASAEALASARQRLAAVLAPAPLQDDVRPDPAAQSPTPVAAAPRPDARVSLLRSHFNLMQEFLSSQTRVLGLMTPPPTATVAAAEAADPDSEAGAWPLLGRVVSMDADSLWCERDVDLARDVFLFDHTLGAAVSARNPELHPLPVIPFTVSMEVVAQAAARLSGKRVIGLYDLRGYRWLALDQGRLRLGVQAGRKPGAPAEIHVRVFVLGDGADRQLVFEGTARLGDEFPAPRPVPPFVLAEEFRPNYAGDKLYANHPDDPTRYAPMFHGPCFQGVKRLRRWGREGIEADFGAIDPNRFFSGLGAARFLTDPALLDSAGQLIGYWVAERFGADLSFFPFRVLKYEQYGPALPPGRLLLCRAHIRIASETGEGGGFEFVDGDDRVVARVAASDPVPASLPPYSRCRLYPRGARLEADFDFIEETGRLWARIEGWQDQYFSIPHVYYRCRLFPQTEYFSTEQPLPVTGVIGRRIDPLPPSFFDDSWGIWKRVLAHLMLGANERRFWYALPDKGPRRGEWLLGRIAAKDAVRAWAERKYGIRLAPADVEILPDAAGRPVVSCPALGDLTAGAPAVSISHSLGCAVAAAADPGVALGIDVERLGAGRSVEFLDGALTPEETALLPAANAEQRARTLLRFWCAKEAAAKCRGTGLLGDPRAWPVVGIDDEHLLVRRGEHSFRVRVWQSPDEVMAICVEYSQAADTAGEHRERRTASVI